MVIQSGIHIIGRRERPTLRRQQETVITEVVVAIADADAVGYPSVQLPQVGINISTTPQDEINNIQLSIARGSIVSICQSQ